MKRGSFVILLAVLATLALASAPAGGQEAKKAGDGQGARKSDASAASTGKEAKQDAQAKAAAKSDATRKSAESDESSGPTLSLTPIVWGTMLSGNERMFAEHWWIQEGVAGGLQDGSFEQRFGKDTLFKVEGHVIADQGDYLLNGSLEKKDFGYVRAGYTQYRKYFNDQGGFYQRFLPRSAETFDLGKDLVLNMGDVFVEAGLTIPDVPRPCVGYEHKFKKGAKSMLEWGSVTETLSVRPTGKATTPGAGPYAPESLPTGSTTKKIYPAFKEIDEQIDLVKAGVEHTIGPVHFGDDFLWEHYSNKTMRFDDSARTINPMTGVTLPSSIKNVTVDETFDHDAFYNTAYVETHLTDWWYVSTGYLFSHLDGDASIGVNTVPYLAQRDKNWAALNDGLWDRSNVVNFNTMVGPFVGLTGYGGFQVESTDTIGDAGDVTLREIASVGGKLVDQSPEAIIRSSEDKNGIEGTAGLRFTAIPFTTFYTEGKWRHEDIVLREGELEDFNINEGESFIRLTDTDVDRQQFTVGFNTSPLSRLTLGGQYRHNVRNNDYNHLIDLAASGLPNSGEGTYSAFITHQKFNIDELTAKATWHPISLLSATFKYQFQDNTITTAHQMSVNPTLRYPGGWVESGHYNSNIYSVSATLTPLSRLYITGLASWQDTFTNTFQNAAMNPGSYNGNVVSFLGTAGYALDNDTDIRVQYLISTAGNFRNIGFADSARGYLSTDYGLPLGIDYTEQGLMLGLTRRINKNLSVGVNYGFFAYDEGNINNANNYTTHLVSGNLSLRW